MRFILLSFFLVVQTARADIPDFFQPLVVKPPFSFSDRIVDLTPAFEKAKRLNKPMLVYLGADDCPPCKAYSVFLERHKEEMRPSFAKVVVVDIRTWLKGPALTFQIYDKKYNVAEFKARVGDANKRLFYPTWWLLTPEGTQLRQLPQGSSNFTSVENHIRLLEGS